MVKSTTSTSHEKGMQPAHVIRFGKIQASIWQNNTKFGPRFNVILCRLYHENGEWKRSESFGRNELLTAAHALEESWNWIWSQGSQEEETANE